MPRWNRWKEFLREAKTELKKVNWPTKDETVRYTGFVIALSLIVAVLLGLLDFVFVQVIERIIF